MRPGSHSATTPQNQRQSVPACRVGAPNVFIIDQPLPTAGGVSHRVSVPLRQEVDDLGTERHSTLEVGLLVGGQQRSTTDVHYAYLPNGRRRPVPRDAAPPREVLDSCW